MIWALDGLLAALRPPWPAFHSIEARSIHPSSRQRRLVVVDAPSANTIAACLVSPLTATNVVRTTAINARHAYRSSLINHASCIAYQSSPNFNRALFNFSP